MARLTGYSMSFFDNLLNYLKDRPTGKKILDGFLMVTVATWVSFAWVVANYFPDVKGFFITKQVDVKNLVKLDKGINDILTTVLFSTGSDRSALARFHDTITDVNGKHFIYESRTNEVVQPGVSMIAQLHQKVLISMIASWAQDFAKDKCVYVTNIQPTDLYYEFLHQVGIKSTVMCPVNNTANQLVGYIMIEYTTQTMKLEEMKTKEIVARQAAEKIGAILSLGNE